MKVDKFHIINLIKDLILAVENNLTNFPKSEIELKKNIRNSRSEERRVGKEC